MEDSPSLSVVLIACKVFQNLIEPYLPEHTSRITFLDYGLHKVPKQLKEAVQEQIDGIETPSLVVLGYGLCGNGLDGIRAGVHTLLIPRTDDCIAILLGSYAAYLNEFIINPGTYYLSKGWLESGSNPLQEYQDYVEKYGAKKASYVMDTMYKNYSRLAFVAHQQADLDCHRKTALEVAAYCERWGMCYQEILGSDRYIRRLGETAMLLASAEDDFIVILPGGELETSRLYPYLNRYCMVVISYPYSLSEMGCFLQENKL